MRKNGFRLFTSTIVLFVCLAACRSRGSGEPESRRAAWQVSPDHLPVECDCRDCPSVVSDFLRTVQIAAPYMELKRLAAASELEVIEFSSDLGSRVIDRTPEWSLRGESRLALEFRARGVTNPEDMGYVLKRLLHACLNERRTTFATTCEQVVSAIPQPPPG